MKKLRRQMIFLRVIIISSFFTCFIVFCSLDLAGGFGSETGTESHIIGTIVNTSGNPLPQTIVTLVPTKYIPLKEIPLHQSMIDTTDANGHYHFTIKDTTIHFNIEAKHLASHTHSLISDIVTIEDTTIVSQVMLKNPGKIQVFLPDTIDTANGFLFLKGTTQYFLLNQAVEQNNGTFLLTLNNIPEAIYPSIFYAKVHKPVIIDLLNEPVQVMENQTTIVNVSYNWIHYTSENSGLPNDTILDIMIETNGTIWFTVSNSGVARLINNTWTVYNTGNSGLPSNNVRKLIIDKRNTLWFATDNGIASFTNEKWEVYDTGIIDMPSNFITGIAEDSKGHKWFSTRKTGSLVKYDNKNWTVFDSSILNQLKRDIIAVQVDKSDIIWGVADSILFGYDGNNWRVQGLLSEGLKTTQVFNFFIDKQNITWIGYQGTLQKFDGNDFTLYNESHSPILNGKILKVTTDSGNNLWIGTTRGLTTYTDTLWIDRIGDNYALLKNTCIQTIAFDNQGYVWTGTVGKGVIAFGRKRGN